MKRISIVATICLATMLCGGCNDDHGPVHPGHEGEAYTDFTDQKTGKQYRAYEGKDGTVSWFDIATGAMVGSMAGNAMSSLLFDNHEERRPRYVPPAITASNLTATRAYSPSLGRSYNVTSGSSSGTTRSGSGIVARGSSFHGMNVGG